MAWRLQHEIDDERGKRISYPSEWVGDSGERMKAATQSVANKLTARYFTPDPGPRPWPESIYDPINGTAIYDPVHGAGPSSGFRQPLPDRPYQRRFTEKVTYLPEILGVSVITSRIRDVIEKLEPGVHQYLPFEFYYKDGEKIPGERWYLNICNRLDTIAAA